MAFRGILMQTTTIPFLLLVVGIQSSPAQHSASSSHPVVVLTRELFDGLATGDTLEWKEHLADSCIIAIEDGSSITKQALLADTRPLPEGYTGRIEILEPHWKEYGSTVVLTFIADEYMTIFGQDIHTQYRETNTFIHDGDDWKLVSMQVMEIPKNPSPVQVPIAALERLAGTYRLAPGVEYFVTVRDGRMFGQRSGRNEEELSAESETMFFTSNPRMRKIFVLGENGRPIRLIDRREGIDLVWKVVR
jgi:hypothetical protein